MPKTIVVNTRLVLSSISSVATTKKTQLRKLGFPLSHSDKFSFKSKNNIITGIFLSGGISVQSYKNDIIAYQTLLEMTFNTEVLISNNDTNYTLKIKKHNENKYIIINFYYTARSISSTDLNEGQRYELDIIEKLKDAGLTTQDRPPKKGPDVTIVAKGFTSGIELKEKLGAAFGSATLEFANNSWRLKDGAKQAMVDLVSDIKLMDFINDGWHTQKNNYIPPLVATKEQQLILGELRKNISAEYIKKYYSDCDYIHIKGYGIYKLKPNNPLGITASTFRPINPYARIRVQYKGSGKYRYALELYINKLTASANRNGLDGDLGFLL